MAANPALVQSPAFPGQPAQLAPAPFAAELFVLRRPAVGLELDGVRTRSGKWAATGTLYLSNVRLVFVADKADASGLAGFDMPLVYISQEKLNQPIFGCNNLSGRVWPAVEGGGPAGALPPHAFKILFKSGGMGTLYPLFYALLQRVRRADAAARQAGVAPPQQQQQQPDASPSPLKKQQQPTLAEEAPAVQQLVHQAFVDPNDPSVIVLSQPVDEAQRLPHQPAYAPNYGRDDKPYEATGLRP